LLELIGKLDGSRPRVRFEDWRIGDQRCYVSDIREFSRATGWRPDVSVREGVERLYGWLKETNRLPVAEEVLERGVA
jgi:CDP-paratose 2-epimerase